MDEIGSAIVKQIEKSFLTYRIVRYMFNRHSKHIGSIGFTVTASLVISIVQLFSLFTLLYWISYWHFSSTRRLFYLVGDSRNTIFLSIAPGTLLLSTLFAFTAWPLCATASNIRLLLQKQKTGIWEHSPVFAHELWAFQRHLLTATQEWLHKKELEALSASLDHIQEPSIPLEMKDLMIDYVSTNQAYHRYTYLNELLEEPIKSIPQMDKQRWIATMTMFARIRPRRLDTDFIVFVRGEGEGDVNDTWIAVFSRDMWILAMFCCCYFSFLFIFW